MTGPLNSSHCSTPAANGPKFWITRIYNPLLAAHLLAAFSCSQSGLACHYHATSLLSTTVQTGILFVLMQVGPSSYTPAGASLALWLGVSFANG